MKSAPLLVLRIGRWLTRSILISTVSLLGATAPTVDRKVEDLIAKRDLQSSEALEEIDTAIKKLGDQAAVVMAKWILNAEPRLEDITVRLAIAHFFSILKQKARAAVPLLADALTASDPRVERDEERVKYIIGLLSIVGTNARASVEPILIFMKRGGANFALPNAVLALSNIASDLDRPAVRRITSFLNEPEFSVRLTAALSLAIIDNPTESVTAVIIKALDENTLPLPVLLNIPNLKGDRTVYLPYLLAFARSEDRELRALTARALGSVGDPGLPFIKKLLADDSASLVSVGVTALRRYADLAGERAWPEVQLVLDHTLREREAEYLHSVLRLALVFPNRVARDPEFMRSLSELATEDDSDVSQHARRVLETLRHIKQ